MSNTTLWTDQLGRSYSYRPHKAGLIAEFDLRLGTAPVLALAEAVRSLEQSPSLPLAGVAAVFFRSESTASSLIEGIQAGPRRILEAEFANREEVEDEPAARIVSNLRALSAALATRSPLAEKHLLQWHRALTEHDPGMSPRHIGAFRTEQNWIGGDAYGPRNASFVPPAPDQVPVLVRDLLAFLRRNDLATILQALIGHAQFEVVHPFADGNGRVGRLLLQHTLLARLQKSVPVPISIAWSRTRDHYLDSLRRYQNGDVEHWVEFGANSIVAACEWMNKTADQLGGIIGELASASGTRGNSVAARVIRDLPKHPLVDTQSVALRYQVSKQAAHQALERLRALAILQEHGLSRRSKTVGRPRRYFLAPSVMELLQRLMVRQQSSPPRANYELARQGIEHS